MLVICEECGRKYRLDPNLIQHDEAWITCKVCKYRFTVRKPEPEPVKTVKEEETGDLLDFVPVEEVFEEEVPQTVEAAKGISDPVATDAVSAKKKALSGRLGLTAKFMLYLLIPFICIYAASSYYSLHKMNQMHDLTLSETSNIVWGIAKSSLKDKAKSVALQTQQYLYSHPDLKNEAFNRDIYFKKIALQKMGVTGYTFLYERPGADGIWRMWAHSDPKLVGIDLNQLRKPLGSAFSEFWKVLTGVENDTISQGFYTWMTPSGQTVNKYMVSVPVAGTPYVIAATTETEEFVRPIDVIEAKATLLSSQTRRANTVALLAGFLILGTIILLYGRNLTARVRHLADVADRICVGELDTDIKTSVQDEIGELGDAIARMRDSIKVSIERLRRRKKRAA